MEEKGVCNNEQRQYLLEQRPYASYDIKLFIVRRAQIDKLQIGIELAL